MYAQININGSILPGQADRWQEITIQVADETRHGFSYALQYVGVKTT